MWFGKKSFYNKVILVPLLVVYGARNYCVSKTLPFAPDLKAYRKMRVSIDGEYRNGNVLRLPG